RAGYLVYQVKGNVWETGSNTRKHVRVGQLLKNDAALWLDTGASIILVCENYSTITLNKKGPCMLSQYSGFCIPSNSSITVNYFRFIWEGLTHPEESPEQNRKKYM